jgi:hypothetical protein
MKIQIFLFNWDGSRINWQYLAVKCTPLGHAFLIKQSCEGVYRPNNLGDLSMQGVSGEGGKGGGGFSE